MIVLAHKESGQVSTKRCSTSYSVKVSFILLWDRAYTAGKSAVVRNTSPELGLRVQLPSQLVKDTFVVIVMERGGVLHRTMERRPFITEFQAKAFFRSIVRC